MSDKFTARQRRSRKLRSKTKEMSNHRLSIFRSNNQIYAQVFSPDGKEVLAHASSADKEAKLDKGGNQEALHSIDKEYEMENSGKNPEAFNRLKTNLSSIWKSYIKEIYRNDN